MRGSSPPIAGAPGPVLGAGRADAAVGEDANEAGIADEDADASASAEDDEDADADPLPDAPAERAVRDALDAAPNTANGSTTHASARTSLRLMPAPRAQNSKRSRKSTPTLAEDTLFTLS
jgi:hypothetical protein